MRENLPPNFTCKVYIFLLSCESPLSLSYSPRLAGLSRLVTTTKQQHRCFNM